MRRSITPSRLSFLGTLVLVPSALLGGTAETVSRSTAKIPRVDHAPALADFLLGNPSRNAAQISAFVQRAPNDGAEPSRQTTAYLSYDRENLYIASVCKDDPQQVRGRLSKREDIGSDDQVLVYLDTFLDRQHSYIFAANPLGIQLDGTLAEGQEEDYKFDTLWYSDGRIFQDGYAVLFTIPFKSLRFSSSPSQTWGIALGRSIRRMRELDFWPAINRRVDGFIRQFGTLDGLENIAPGKNIQLIPYGAVRPITLLDPNNRDVTHVEKRAGLDSKIVFRNRPTLDATVNPDFSQVESDDPQITVNQRYEVFFPEKRPFFLENSNYFATPINLFFSRRIADPEFGARLTGQVDNWAIGAFAIDDREPGDVLSPSDPLFHDHAVIGVGRIQRQFHSDSSIGALFTDWHFGP